MASQTPAGPAPLALLAAAERAADTGAEILREYFRSRDLRPEEKTRGDFVTRADKESERAIVESVLGEFPDHEILAEEGGLRESAAPDARGEPYRWIIDPLDGTANFMQGLPMFCISIACRRGDETLAAIVLEPLRDERFTAARGHGAFWNGRAMRTSERPGAAGSFLATGYPFRVKSSLDIYLEIFRALLLEARGIRRCGAAALDLAYTAAGVYDGFFVFRLSPWDIAAGVLLVREAGGVSTDLDGGGGSLKSGNVLAGGAGVHRDLLSTVARFAGEGALDRHSPRG
ncbi:MAG: inositol monophosphatase family protein [Acidobacteriota bacterium]